jgi:hypothetical protein
MIKNDVHKMVSLIADGQIAKRTTRKQNVLSVNNHAEHKNLYLVKYINYFGAICAREIITAQNF